MTRLKLKASYLLFALCCLFAFNRSAAQTTAGMYMTAPDSVPVNQEFVLEVVIKNAGDSGFKAPDLQNFVLDSGPYISSSMNMLKNEVRRTSTYTFILKPRQKGIFKIGEARITNSKVHLESNEVNIVVTDSVSKSSPVSYKTTIYSPVTMDAPDSVSVNQAFSLDIKVEGAAVSDFRPPDLSAFEVVERPVPNGIPEGLNKLWYPYMLKPKKEGAFKIGKASFMINGIYTESLEHTIVVTKAKTYRLDTAVSPEILQEAKNDMFVGVITDKDTMYTDEALKVTYVLYYRLYMANLKIGKEPQQDGFKVEHIHVDSTAKVDYVKGLAFNKVELAKYNLYPQHTGNLQIEPLEVSAVDLGIKAAGIAMRGFSTPPKHYAVPLTLKSKPKTITVLEKPQKR